MMARVTVNGVASEAFTAFTNGVKQNYVLAPTLFILMFPAMLVDAYCDDRHEIHIAYRIYGQLLNERRMHSTLVSTATNSSSLITALSMQ
ncbi:unnamed protein product [Schistocephalus solidus]|uniref:ABC transmembrane type-1 domain-containing protein n=1 Tax=Schistocephalus solidus TaxID=70667 RepID=A0A183SH13_SCHSO|nr:unnamed protein product [Schistocephalus solidus]